MKVTPCALEGVLLLEPARHGDQRGFFSETYNRRDYEAAGLKLDFVQDNHSRSPKRGTLRGLHFQVAPHAQTKVVRVTRGAILDVVVDLRRGSATYGRHVAIELSAKNWKQLLVPAGLAHGFMTLTDDCEVLYKVTNYYAPEAEKGLRWDDPGLGIQWPIAASAVTVNARDAAWPGIEEAPDVLPA